MRRNCLKAMCLAACLIVSYGLPAMAVPVTLSERSVRSGARTIAVSALTVDLRDPGTVLTMAFAGGRPVPAGDEDFAGMVRRTRPAAAINGSFFSTRSLEVMGNLVQAGRLVQHRRWEDRGTAFSVSRSGQAEMRTIRAEGWPDYAGSWLSLACGPRLLRDGQVWLHPQAEGFQYDHVFATTSRSALGFSHDGRWLTLVAFRTGVSLQQEADVMRQLGCWQAMNLDGGGSVALSFGGRTVVSPGRALTNVLLVYDTVHPAPGLLTDARGDGDPGDRVSDDAGPPPHFAPGIFGL